MAMNFSQVPSASSIFSAYASLSTTMMLLQTMLNQLIPRQVQSYIWSKVPGYITFRPSSATLIIEERDGMGINEMYTAAEDYLSSKIRRYVNQLKVSKRNKDMKMNVKFAKCDKIFDWFEGIEIEWKFFNEERKGSKVMDENSGNVFYESEKKYFALSFDKKHKDKVLDFYLPFVLETAKSMKAKNKIIKLHTLLSSHPSTMWDSVTLHHPSTFDTLAMEPQLKNSVIDDLNRFIRRKDFYRRVGRAWKRGYLLYGPPGTGKSSLIAAMANYLKFDIYDLELTNIRSDSDLRKLLLRTGNKSILVIEDIDCSVDLPDRKEHKSKDQTSNDGNGKSRQNDQQFTLSGLLNFIDGLWSSCGDERIIVVTTNNKDKLDPALLRPGRMDMHIHMSYIGPEGFKTLASTYLGIQGKHPRFEEIEELIGRMNVTPAEVAEQLMKSDDPDASLEELVNFLNCKRIESDIANNGGIQQNEVQNIKRSDDSDIEVVTD